MFKVFDRRPCLVKIRSFDLLSHSQRLFTVCKGFSQIVLLFCN